MGLKKLVIVLRPLRKSRHHVCFSHRQTRVMKFCTITAKSYLKQTKFSLFCRFLNSYEGIQLRHVRWHVNSNCIPFVSILDSLLGVYLISIWIIYGRNSNNFFCSIKNLIFLSDRKAWYALLKWLSWVRIDKLPITIALRQWTFWRGGDKSGRFEWFSALINVWR
jgi:hypothetical protein